MVSQLTTTKGTIMSIDITDIWLSCHAHLRPNANYLKTNHISKDTCDLCGCKESIKIRAKLTFSENITVNDGVISYCFHCQKFAIAETNLHLSSVDARLWSNSPTVLNLEPTTRCNFSCWYCIGRTLEQEDIKFENFTKALENFPNLKMLALVGEGEPLLHKDFFDMVIFARKKGVDVYTTSNGSAFSTSVIQKICESGITYISISIDSIDEDIFVSSRIDGKLSKIWQGIENLVKYKNEHGFKYPILGLKGTLFDYSEHDLPQIIKESKKRGFDVFENYQPLNPKKSYVDIYPLDKHYLLNTVEQIRRTIQRDAQQQALNENERLISIQEFVKQQDICIQNIGTSNGIRANCDEEWITALLSGTITPCCQIRRMLNPQWNLFEYPLQNILSNHEYENMRFNLWNGLFLTDCEGCSKVTGI